MLTCVYVYVLVYLRVWGKSDLHFGETVQEPLGLKRVIHFKIHRWSLRWRRGGGRNQLMQGSPFTAKSVEGMLLRDVGQGRGTVKTQK